MQGGFVDTVIVDGKTLVKQHHLITADETSIIHDAQRQGNAWMDRRNAAASQLLQPIRD
jgi:hypothetical protein